MSMKRNLIHSMLGKEFGHWTVKRDAGRDSNNNSIALCQCRCGEEKIVRLSRIKSGRSLACGCQTGKTHGKSSTPEHMAWKNIKQRTSNPKRADYARYGGAGITMCKEWFNSFEEFYAHVGPRPSPDHSIDRKNSKKGYEPGNVRWATALTQNNNTKRNVNITFNGETMTASQWAKRLGVNPSILTRRILRGWSHSRTISTPC